VGQVCRFRAPWSRIMQAEDNVKQRRRLDKLYGLHEALQWEVLTLRQLLSDLRVLPQGEFAVKLHRHRFQQYRRASGWTSDAKLLDVLGDPSGAGEYDAFGILPYAGQRAVQALRSTSRSAQVAPGEVAGKLYALGGISDGAQPQLVGHRFDFSKGSWETVPQFNVARYFSPGALLGGELYFCGTAGLGSRSVESFNPSTGRWKMLPAMQQTRYGHTLVALGGRLYACGGWKENNATMHDAECFNPKVLPKGRWEAVSPMLKNRGHAVAGALCRKLLICGGFSTCGEDDGECLKCTEQYDPQRNIWEAAPTMLEQRSCAAGAVVNTRFYISGGESPPGTVLSSMELLEPGSTAWTALPPMSLARKLHAMATAVGRIYVLGGSPVTGLAHEPYEEDFPDELRVRTVECFDPGRATWEPLQHLLLPTGIVGLSAAFLRR